jgi:5'-3' exoribonuclease 2
MGVPAFYRWLISRYPKIVLNNIENPPSTTTPGSDQSPPAVDQYDNLYIDMNGLIHPCSHPEDRPPPSSEQEIFDNIALYVDRLFAAIQPSRLLFLSIDGVAPRAKMNQQRARRYRAAQDRQERDKLTSQVISELFPDVSLPETPHIWDSNVITPGTEFMSHLSDFLHRYIEEKMRTEDNWKNIKVILSDASVCGEGEHKIMAFIRSQRTQEGYDPNQHHVVHGLDADLIMLALGTHEPKFSILREEQMSTYEKKKEKRRLSRTQASAADNEDEVPTASADDWVHAQKLLCLRVEYLREYFSSEYDFLRESLGERFDLERIIDDLIFLCYFVGNDFLPHLPTLEIREGGIDLLLSAYKQLMPYWPGYLTGTEVNGERVIYTPQVSFPSSHQLLSLSLSLSLSLPLSLSLSLSLSL